MVLHKNHVVGAESDLGRIDQVTSGVSTVALNALRQLGQQPAFLGVSLSPHNNVKA